MKTLHVANRSFAFASIVLALTLGCGGGSDSGDETPGSTRPECKLLTVAEVTAEIGEHLGPEADLAYGGCLWRSGRFDPATAFARHVRVSVRTQEEFEALAEIGDGVPQDAFAPGAVWGELYRHLWWPCGSKMCLVIAALEEVEPSLESALRLGQLVKDRL